MSSANEVLAYRDPRGTGSVRYITATGERGNYRFFVDSLGDKGSLTLNMWEQFVTSGDIRPVFRPVTVAPMGTPCGWTAIGETGTKLTCHSDLSAIHILTMTLPVATAGTALCAFHSPADPTDAERQAVGQPFQTMGEAGAARLAKRQATPAETGKSGVEILADVLTLDTVDAPTFDPVAFHKLSAAMVTVLEALSSMRGQVSAWHMAHVIKARRSTVEALIKRDMITKVVNANDGTPGSLVDYRLSATGLSTVEAMGCPVVCAPSDPQVAAALVEGATGADCATGCEVIFESGAHMLPMGGQVCHGCGSVFTRPGEQADAGIVAVSLAVVARNQAAKGRSADQVTPDPVAVWTGYRTFVASRSGIQRGVIGHLNTIEYVSARDSGDVNGSPVWAAYCLVLHRDRSIEAAYRQADAYAAHLVTVATETPEEISARHKREDFRLGDPVTFVDLVGYRDIQDRPFACRTYGKGCQCGKACGGTRVESREYLTDVRWFVSGGLEIVGHLGGFFVVRPDRLD